MQDPETANPSTDSSTSQRTRSTCEGTTVAGVSAQARSRVLRGDVYVLLPRKGLYTGGGFHQLTEATEQRV